MVKKIKNLSPFHYFLILVIANLALMILADIFYNGRFDFLRYPLSDLGSAFNQVGLPNTVASNIYSVGMFLTGILLFFLAHKLRKTRQNNTSSPLLAFMGGSGALIAGASPDDTLYAFHVIGSTLLVASLWALATMNLYEVRKNLGHAKYYFLQFAILQTPIIAYALAFFMGLKINDILQKPAFISLAFILLYSTHAKRQTH